MCAHESQASTERPGEQVVNAPIPDQPLAEPPVLLDAGLAIEVQELAALLAETVLLARNRAMFPGRLAVVAELALGHDSVRRALAAEETAS